MSVLGKTPYIKSVLGSLTSGEKSRFNALLDSSLDTYRIYHWYTGRGHEFPTTVPTSINDRICIVDLHFDLARHMKGYLIYTSNHCTFIGAEDGTTKTLLPCFKLDVANRIYTAIEENLDIEELRTVATDVTGGGVDPSEDVTFEQNVTVEGDTYTNFPFLVLSGTSGEITHEQLTELQNFDSYRIKVGDDEYVKVRTLDDKLIYTHFEADRSKQLEIEFSNDPEEDVTWSILDVSFGGKPLVLTSSGETGSLTSDDITFLYANDSNYIVLDDEFYYLADDHVSEEHFSVYTHCGRDADTFIKSLYVYDEEYSVSSKALTWERVKIAVNKDIQFLSTAPSIANPVPGTIRFVVLDSEPAEYKDGYFYIIKE